MRYRVLGPITVELDGHAAKLGGLRQRMVLAVLLRSANRVVTQDALIDSVWAGKPPEAARATVQSYIYNLRRALGPDSILRRSDGYLVEVDADSFDVLSFEESVKRGGELLATDPALARTTLIEGLDLWFGTAYGGVDHPELDAEIRRLGEMRVTAIEARIDADLALGRAGELVAELESLVRDYPLRERFWGQLMLALYRSGRQAESLRAFQNARAHLVDHLGIEPGSELQDLEARILDHDPSLLPSVEADASAAGDRSRRSIRGYELRDVIGSGEFGVVHRAYQPSIGREVAIKIIQADSSNDLTFVARFEREAQRVANLEHPHVLPLHDYWRDPSGAYLVMPLMRGGSLEKSLRGGGWNLEPALRLLDQVGGSLAYAHRRGVLHGNLKTGNILLDEDGNAYLSDFRIADPVIDGVDRLASQRLLSPEEASGEEVSLLTDIFALGAVTFELLSGVPPTGKSHLPDLTEARRDLPESVAAVVAQAMAADPSDRFLKVNEFLRELRRSAGVDVVAASEVVDTVPEQIRNPYKGLRAFAEVDAVDFHGREALIDDLIERIAGHRLVTVVGPSGSGKSSLVRAGLIPALRAGSLNGSRDWLVTDMFPGSFPFEELEAALSRVAVRTPGRMLSELTQPNGLLRVSKQILPGDDSTLLIVIDQFEELFSTVRSEETRRRFLENLISVANDERSRVRVVTTIRADFLDRPLAYADFAEAIADGLVTVGPPTRDGLAQAVSAPARTVGLELEPGLVGRIIADVEGQPGALPLLQYALTEMFSHRERSTLTISGYEAAGGVAGALGRRAEDLYDGLTPAGKLATREVFLRLVSVDEMGVVTRRRARQSELVSLDVDRSGLESVLTAFAGFRLLTFDRDPVTRGPTVEVAHEALLTEWSRLRGWIEDARESLVLARRVGESAHEWLESGEDPSYLLRGIRLEDVKTWAANADVVLTEDESRYIAASIEQRGADVSAARRRRRRTVAALTGGLVLVSILAVVAFLLRGVAQQEALQARVRELATASESQLGQNRELALLIAAEAFDASIQGGAEPNSEAVSAMAQAIAGWRLVSRFPAGPIVLPVASPDGSLIAVSSKTTLADVNVFDAQGSLIRTLPGPADPSVAAGAVTFGPDGETIAVTYAVPENDAFRSVPSGIPDIRVFDLTTGSSVLDLDTEHGWPDVSYSPDGEQLAVSFDHEVRILDSADGREISVFEASSVVGRPEFLDDDDVLVPIEGSGFTIFSASDGSVLDHLEVAELNPIVTATNEFRTHIAYRAGEHLRVLEMSTEEVVFEQMAPSALSVALDPDATRLAYSGFDPNIYVLPIGTTGDTGLELAGTFENVLSLAFIGEKGLLSYGEDALLWDVSPEGMSELGGVPLAEPQWGYQVSPDERWLAYSVSTNNGAPLGDPVDGLRLIDLVTGDEMVVSQGEWNSVEAGIRVVSADFTMVGSLTQDGASTLRSLPTWEVLREFDECQAPLAVSPDKTRVFLSGWGCGSPDAPESAHSAVVDLESGEEILALPHKGSFSADFNRDGFFAEGTLLFATDQISVGIWDLTDGRLLGSLDRDDYDEFGNILVVHFDTTGRYLVGGTTGGTVWVVDLERVIAGEDMADALVFNRQAHTGAAPMPAMNGENVVATAGFDGMVRLWEVHSEDLILEFKSDVGIPVVRFSPDGNEFLYPDGLSIRRMPVDPHELRDLANELLTRDFLPDECARYATAERCEAPTG
ncbi:MAG TPA: BTAD domain-containing putative transcriptional regulator [Acidimicrobiia bacterium]|nr:BTAD domain-containing putative transcriptional regulator [Acidimicrobiia bacterium]